jgi:creatinine amidohydrolase
MELAKALPHQFATAIEQNWPLVVPTGCVEYHGPHMPLGSDTLIVQTLLQRVSERVECMVAPPIWYGPTGYAVSGPRQGTMDVSIEHFGRHVKDILSSFWEMGFRWIIVYPSPADGWPGSAVDPPGSREVTFDITKSAVRLVGQTLPAEDNVFERLQVWPSVLPAAAEKGVVMADHAGFYETSLVMAAYPELVEAARLGMNPPWYSVTPDSKARKATVEDGERMWQAMVSAWVDQINALNRPKRISPKDVTVTGIF